MARFKKGDKVFLLKNDELYGLYLWDTGVVDEDDDKVPYVIWDKDGRKIAVEEENLTYSDTSSQIAQIIEQSIVVNGEAPIDTFEFSFKDEYGREIIHKFEEEMGVYTLVDVVASFRLFLRGIGWEREEVDKFIRDEML